MEAANEAFDVPLDADDLARDALPSDDEDGPDNPDEEMDARAPGENIEEEDADGARAEMDSSRTARQRPRRPSRA